MSLSTEFSNKRSWFHILLDQVKIPKNYILLFFGLIYSLISIVNHFNYRTTAFDLGIYNNCLYQYGHFHKNHYPYLHTLFNDFLADHFSLYTVILSPLHYVFGTSTLLFIQILSVLSGAVGVYKIIKLKSNVPFLPEIGMIHYLSFFGIYSAFAFDYHDNVVSAMLLPWMIYFFESKKRNLTLLFLLLTVIGKENMPIWLTFVGIGLILLNLKDKEKRNLAVLITFFSIIYTVLVFKVFMPFFDDSVHLGYHGFKYSVLGANSKEFIHNLIHDPIRIFKALFVSHKPEPEFQNIKKELYMCLLYSGAWMLLMRPQFIVMLIPIIAQKVFSDDFQKWGISAHYSIEFAPIIVIGFYQCLEKFNKPIIIQILAVIGCILTMKITYDKLETRDSIYYDKINGSFLIKEHYQCEFSKNSLKKAMNLIPENAKLSCLNKLAPHLSFREYIYQYPDVHDAGYILLANSEFSYPFRGKPLIDEIEKLKHSDSWSTLYADKGVFLFKKK